MVQWTAWIPIETGTCRDILPGSIKRTLESAEASGSDSLYILLKHIPVTPQCL